MNQQEVVKRLSVRKVAMLYGIPSRVVARAIASGDLPALQIATETGRNRAYISYDDASRWISKLQSGAEIDR